MDRPRTLSSIRPHATLPALLALALLLPGESESAWPPPPGSAPAVYADAGSWPSDPDWPTQFHLHSFAPVRDGGSLSAADLLLGPGARIDRAFSSTTGHPSVKVAIVSTGARWEEKDLVNRWALSRGELPPPRNDAGVVAPGADPHDRNGDGRFNVQDYTEAQGAQLPTPATVSDPRLTSRPDLGDANGNGLLDPQDLLAVFGDGADGDGNGFVDDVCGFDFQFEDPDAEDDLHVGPPATAASPGRAEALAASAQADNGEGGVGACPDCALVPLRVGNTTRVGPTALGTALLYARAVGATTAALGVESLGDSPYLRDAARFAQEGGVLLVAAAPVGLGPSESVPAALPGVLSPRPLLPDLPFPETSTFLHAQRCGATAHGGTVAAPFFRCGSGLSGFVAGAAALLHSSSLDGGARPTPGELSALLYGAAEVLPGADRFTPLHGHGRLDLERAVLNLRGGRLPPEVALPAPTANVSYLQGRAVTVTAAVHARGPTELILDVASGEDPAEAAFVEVGRRSIPAGAFAGEVAVVPAERLPEPGSGAAAAPFWLRLRAATGNGDGGTVESTARRLAYVHSPRRELGGFPVQLGGSIEGGVLALDLNETPGDEVVVAAADGRLTVLAPTGEPMPGFPASLTPLRAFAQHPGLFDGGLSAGAYFEPVIAPVAVGNITGGRSRQIVALTLSGQIHVLERDGTPVPGFPVDTAATALPCFVPFRCSPAGRVEEAATPPLRRTVVREVARGFVAAPALSPSPQGPLVVAASLDGTVHVYLANGQPLPGFPFALEPSTFQPAGTDREERIRAHLVAPPAVTDLDGDGWPEIAVGSSESYRGAAGSTRGYLIDTATGTLEPGWPVELGTIASAEGALFEKGVAAGAVFADLTGDAKLEVVFQGFTGPVSVFSIAGAPLFSSGPLAAQGRQQLAVGDLGGTGAKQLFAASSTPGGAGLFGLAVREASFVAMPAFPQGFPAPVQSGFVLADLDGVEGSEVATVDSTGQVRAFREDGTPAFDPAIAARGEVASGPAVGALQGGMALLAGSRRGLLSAFRVDGRLEEIQWDSSRHDPANTGSLTTQLPSRAVSGIGVPAEPPEPGGCCSQAPGAQSAFALLWAGLLLRASARKRRASDPRSQTSSRPGGVGVHRREDVP